MDDLKKGVVVIFLLVFLSLSVTAFPNDVFKKICVDTYSKSVDKCNTDYHIEILDCNNERRAMLEECKDLDSLEMRGCRRDVSDSARECKTEASSLKRQCKSVAREEMLFCKGSPLNDNVFGDPNASVKMIEFVDYQDPFSRKFWTETYPLLKKDYLDKGKVRLELKNFPLSSPHPSATLAALAIECVKDVGGENGYGRYYNKLFSEQNLRDSGSITGPVTHTVQFNANDLNMWANETGYNINGCLDSEEFIDKVAEDLTNGSSMGVHGTPSFVINGKLISGAQPYSVFKQAIDAEL